MNEIPLKQVIDASLENLKKIVSVDTVVGTPITLPNDTTVIPVSKVSVGFTSGGADYGSKLNVQKDRFAGGNAGGVTVTPVGFLVINGGNVQLLCVSKNGGAVSDGSAGMIGTITDFIERSPDLIERFKAVFSKKTKEENKEDAEAAE